jgi:nucleotide-binding universal stress UspA family protein
VVKRLKKGDVISGIIETAQEESVNLIIMGATPVKVVAEWVSTGVIERAPVPVIIIPYEFNKVI